jgi:uncharacterized repeat protein (TIGR03803 family)
MRLSLISRRLALAAAAAMIGGPAGAGGAHGYHVEYAFTGSQLLDDAAPSAPLVELRGKLYGTVPGQSDCKNGCGAVFSFDPTTGVETTVYTFKGGQDGSTPAGGLIAVDGVLYGVTSTGGAGCGGGDGCGTVFALDPATGGETVLHAFAGDADGAFPYARLVNVAGKLYGATKYGGCPVCQGWGVIFSVDATSAAESVVYAFGGGADGAYPLAGLTRDGALLYGTTSGGGDSTACDGGGCGTVFALDPDTGAKTIVHSFQNTDGDYPAAPMIKVHQSLYGTTYYGGGATGCANGCGVAYAIDIATGEETVAHAFQSGADGATPQAGLVSVGARLYGTTIQGGSASKGVVFSSDRATNAETVLHSFKGGQDGAAPVAGLVDTDEALFGTTLYGGSTDCAGEGCGTIYTLDP